MQQAFIGCNCHIQAKTTHTSAARIANLFCMRLGWQLKNMPEMRAA